MTLKAYRAGMECPPLVAGKLRIYSMRFCPFCHRSLLVLQAKNIPHEIINLDLKNKPEWHFKLNPAGKVPILQQDDKILYESLVVSEYLDEAYGKTRLMSTDPYIRAKDKLFVEAATAAAMPMLKIHHNKDSKDELWAEFRGKLNLFEDELKERKSPFFSGNQPGFVDYMIWPFFPKASTFTIIFPELKFPTCREFPLLVQWMEAMKKDGAVTALKLEDHLVDYTRGVLEGNTDYDVGL
uniref:Putative glutathione s-transferase n=1 Tax=Ixodes ricinus TaxID=34613 RepID=A0A131XVF6_IXORI